VRSRVELLVSDLSGMPEAQFAIYTLADPRNVAEVRYVGLTRAPRRRSLQHVHTARLWLPEADDAAWWVRTPKLRPLYQWLRLLHRDEYRLPAMTVIQWVASSAEARVAERSHIEYCLGVNHPLLNFEAQLAARQMRLPLPQSP
jgi:hypothetical protein